MYVKPAEGLKVRDPVKKDHLPDGGREVSDLDLYWQRRLRDKDVVLADPPSANAVRKTPAPPPPAEPADGAKS
jgi:hypothetical protein